MKNEKLKITILMIKFLKIKYMISHYTAQKMKFSVKLFFSKSEEISHLLKKSLMENFIFCAVQGTGHSVR